MSLKSAEAFYDRVTEDSSLVEKLKTMTVKEAEIFVKEELGYSFTEEEMQKVIFERNPELSDEELEAVAGGLSQTEKDIIGYTAFGAGLAITGGGLTLVIIAAAA